MAALEGTPRSNSHANVSSGNGFSATTASSGAPSNGYPKPMKSFLPSSTKATTAVNNGVLHSKINGDAAQRKTPPMTWSETPSQSTDGRTGTNGLAGSEPSSIPNNRNRPRRESIGQMRRKASDSASAAAAGGGLPFAFATRGQPIPSSRSASRGFSTSPRLGADAIGNSNSTGPVSASLGSAAEALSLPASVLNSGAKSGRSTGHTHFGQECFGPEPGENIPNPPSNLTKNAQGATSASVPNGQATSVLGASTAEMDRRGSVSESMNGDDDSVSSAGGRGANGKELPVHRCESCNKIYRHPSCLIKHRWEHTVYWKEASKFLMSKHQQVQLLEAAAILVNLDGDTASLPDEKALWPAAVSPATSGLLGSDKVNFDKMMQRKHAMRGNRRPSDASTIMSPTSSARELSIDNESGSVNSGLARSASGGLSPLNSFTKLGLSNTPISRNNGLSYSRSYSSTSGVPYSYGSRVTSEIQHLTLDESDERSTKGGNDDEDEDDEYEGEEESSGRNTSISAESPEDYGELAEGKGGDKRWGLHEDAVADMDMDE
ncbi:unnamed protein product [Sympodiomycopsis kandeliae]